MALDDVVDDSQEEGKKIEEEELEQRLERLREQVGKYEKAKERIDKLTSEIIAYNKKVEDLEEDIESLKMVVRQLSKEVRVIKEDDKE